MDGIPGWYATEVILVRPPRFNLLKGVFDPQEPIHVQTSVAERSIETLDDRVIRWLATSRVVCGAATYMRPPVSIQQSGLHSVVTFDPFWVHAFGCGLAQRLDDVANRQPAIRGDLETPPTIEYRPQSTPESSVRLVAHRTQNRQSGSIDLQTITTQSAGLGRRCDQNCCVVQIGSVRF